MKLELKRGIGQTAGTKTKTLRSGTRRIRPARPRWVDPMTPPMTPVERFRRFVEITAKARKEYA